MKGWIKTSLAAALAATVGLGATAAVAGPWGDCDGPRGGKHAMGQRMGPEAMAERATEHLAQLQAALALKPEQTAAWEQFKGVMQDKARTAVERMQSLRNEAPPATALARMERMEGFARERMDAMTAVHAAAAKLYAVLDTAQKRTFDEQFSGFGPGGMGPAGKGAAGKGRHHMGPGWGPGMGPRGAG